jgi:restriction system protein
MAMMSYSGTIGRPGSYYLRVDELVDANGQHLGEAAPSEPSATASAAGDIAASVAAPSTETGKIPAIISRAPPATTAPGASIPAITANTNNVSPLAVTSLQRAAGEPADSSAHDWVPVAALALFTAALAGFLALRGRHGRSEKYAPALEIAVNEIRVHRTALRAAKSDSMRPDRYGTMHPDGWEREKALFVRSRLSARLGEAGCQDMLPSLMPAIDTEIERQANASVEPHSSASDADTGHAYRATAAPEIDHDLSTFAVRCTSLLQDSGWKTEPGSAGTGKTIDILAERDGHKLLLQCKGGGAPVGVEAVQQVFAMKDGGRVDIAAIVSHAPFTRAAQQMASANGVHALHDDGLMQLIQ